MSSNISFTLGTDPHWSVTSCYSLCIWDTCFNLLLALTHFPRSWANVMKTQAENLKQKLGGCKISRVKHSLVQHHWPTKPEDHVEQVCPAEIQIIYSQRSNTDWAKQHVSELRESALCDVEDKAGVEPVWAPDCCCQLNCPANLLAKSQHILCIDKEKAAVLWHPSAHWQATWYHRIGWCRVNHSSYTFHVWLHAFI